MRASRAAAAAVVVGLVLTGCGGDGGEGGASAPSGTATKVSPSPTGESTSAADAATAAELLAPFFASARDVDSRLRAAAALVNADLTADQVDVGAATREAIEGIDVTVLADRIPPGMPPELLRRVLLVYSVLLTRRAALSGVEHLRPGPQGREPSADCPDCATPVDDMLDCLASGSSAARRFAGDLADAEALAASTPVLPALPEDSTPAADVAVRAAALVSAANACGSCFGHVATELDEVVWGGAPAGWHGTVNGVPFRATYVQGTGWDVAVDAC